MSRKSNVKDYILKDRLDKQGRIKSEAVYVGDYYVFDNAESDIRSKRLLIMISLIVSASIFFSTLFIDTPSAYKSFIVMPQFIALIPIIISLSYSFALFNSGKLTNKQKNDIEVKAVNATAIAIILATLTVVARMINIIMYTVNLSQELMLILSSMMVLALIVYIYTLFKKINIKLDESNIK